LPDTELDDLSADGEIDTACRLAAENQDLTLLIKMFDKIVETV
jgi:hypothetical protein